MRRTESCCNVYHQFSDEVCQGFDPAPISSFLPNSFNPSPYILYEKYLSWMRRKVFKKNLCCAHVFTMPDNASS